jgi:uncharacterized protein with WD repeat
MDTVKCDIEILKLLNAKISDFTDSHMDDELGLIIFICEININNDIHFINITPNISIEKRKQLFQMSSKTFKEQYENKYLYDVLCKIN